MHSAAEAPTDSGGTARVNADEAARWNAAARVRQERPGWVVIWVARKSEFQARPLFHAPPDTVATGATPEKLIVQMDQFQRAANRRKRPART